MGPGMHDSWMYGGFGMWLWPVLVIGLIIALILFFGRGYSARNFRSSDAGPDESAETALDVLKKRYAKGEISKEEFDRMKKDILSERHVTVKVGSLLSGSPLHKRNCAV